MYCIILMCNNKYLKNQRIQDYFTWIIIVDCIWKIRTIFGTKSTNAYFKLRSVLPFGILVSRDTKPTSTLTYHITQPIKRTGPAIINCKSLMLTSFFPDYHLFYPERLGKIHYESLRHLSSSPSEPTLINMEYPLGFGCLPFFDLCLHSRILSVAYCNLHSLLFY